MTTIIKPYITGVPFVSMELPEPSHKEKYVRYTSYSGRKLKTIEGQTITLEKGAVGVCQLVSTNNAKWVIAFTESNRLLGSKWDVSNWGHHFELYASDVHTSWEVEI